MPDFMLIGVLIALTVAWKIRDNELMEARREARSQIR